MAPLRQLNGERFGRLTVRWPSGRRGHNVFWLCSCDCGGLIVVSGANIGKSTNSCGCWEKENRIKHGVLVGKRDIKLYPPEYRTWVSIKQRCSNPGTDGWELYGGRGIKVCDRWMRSFESFLADMGSRPSHRHSIDRINNDGNYEPRNCRWATPKQQANNRRKLMLRGRDGRYKKRMTDVEFKRICADGVSQ